MKKLSPTYTMRILHLKNFQLSRDKPLKKSIYTCHNSVFFMANLIIITPKTFSVKFSFIFMLN